MSILSHYTRNKLYGSLLGMDTFEKPQTYIGLATAAPTDPPGTAVEPTGSDYNRVLYSKWSITQNRKVSNSTTISFYSRSNWGTITHYLLWDAQEGGNLLGYGPLDSSVAVPTNKVISFSKGKLSFQVLSGTITNYLANVYLNHLFGITSLFPLSSCYVGMSYTNPGDTGHPVTPTVAEYHDVEFQGWNVTDDSTLLNASIVDFPIPASDWGILPYVFVRDGENRVLFYSALVQPFPADPYSPVIFSTGDLSFIFD